MIKEQKSLEKEYDYKTKSWFCKKCKLENCECKVSKEFDKVKK